MSNEEQELSKVTYHAGNLIPNVIPSPKLAKSKKVTKSKKVKSSNASQDDLYPSAYREMLRRQENDRANGEREANERANNWTEGSYSTGTRTGRRTKAQIQEDRIAEELRRQEASQRITLQNGHSIIPICECVFQTTFHNTVPLHDTRRQNVRGKRRNICTICELERITDSELSL